MRAIRQPDRGRSPGDFLHCHDMLQIAHAGAAVFVLHGDAEHAEVAEFAPEIHGKGVVAVDGRGAWGDFIGGERLDLCRAACRRSRRDRNSGRAGGWGSLTWGNPSIANDRGEQEAQKWTSYASPIPAHRFLETGRSPGLNRTGRSIVDRLVGQRPEIRSTLGGCRRSQPLRQHDCTSDPRADRRTRRAETAVPAEAAGATERPCAGDHRNAEAPAAAVPEPRERKASVPSAPGSTDRSS